MVGIVTDMSKSAFGVEHTFSKTLKEGWKVGSRVRGTRKALRASVRNAKKAEDPTPYGTALLDNAQSIARNRGDWSALSPAEKAVGVISNQRNTLGVTAAGGATGYGIYRKKR